MIPNQGIVASNYCIKNLRKVLEIRDVLEGLAARLATTSITEKEKKN
jgi:DNA-binding GntR family transcriptional regulator